ncbi:universal stress protein [Pseudomonas sp. BBP2017]|uniref:universal stress protein n=1 Tax=Pseudomonas sp. BBP2017 TaxID=2109731 RepID=UPI000D11F3F4|nr:universal stress protein [Pseudomonas sp. BBP2017]PSS51662.1 universal stress protein [Pseudomonas sp. BBP2017]
MSQYRQLLLILSEVDPRSAALHRAVSLAKASGAALHVLGIFEQSELRLHDELRDPQVADASLNHFKKSFNDLMEELRDDSLQLTGEVMQAEDAHASVLDYITELNPDMLITRCHPTSLLARAFQPSLEHALLRHYAGLIHFVAPDAPAMPRSIMIAVDVSDPGPEQQVFNQQLIRAAQRLALQCNGQLSLMSVYDLPAPLLANASLAKPWIEPLREALQAPFDALADAHGVSLAHRYFLQGAPVQIITEQVQTLAIDVLVMGVVQPKRWAKLIGDTTERIVGQAICSVLAVKPPKQALG